MSLPLVLIMAGGRGTRLAHSGVRVPKPLVPVGGRPVIELLLRRLLRAGAQEVYVSLGHRAAEVRDAIARMGLPLEPRFLLETEPRGTLGALGELARREGEVLVANGDLVTSLDFGSLVVAHRARGADLSLATHEEVHRLRFGEVDSDAQGRVSAYREKPEKRYRVCSGIALVGARTRALIAERARLDLPELVQLALDAGHHVRSHAHDADWVDVNDGDDLARARALVGAHPQFYGLLHAGA